MTRAFSSGSTRSSWAPLPPITRHRFPAASASVALARALIAEPSMLLLDEPFAALDPALRTRMRSELSALQARLQVPMLMITHDPADVEIFGDHVFELRDGRVVADAVRAPDAPPLSPYPHLTAVVNR